MEGVVGRQGMTELNVKLAVGRSRGMFGKQLLDMPIYVTPSTVVHIFCFRCFWMIGPLPSSAHGTPSLSPPSCPPCCCCVGY